MSEQKILSEESYNLTVDLDGTVRLPRKEGNILNKWKTKLHTYQVIPYESLPIIRLELFQNFGLGFGVDKTFKQIIETSQKIQTAALSDTSFAQARKEIIYLTDYLINNVKEIGEGRISAMYYMAAILTKIEGEDIRYFDEEMANKKIQDWKDSGIAGMDFFFFVGSQLPDFGNYWNNLRQV